MKFYEILVVEQGSQELSTKELRFGPYLMQGTSSSLCPKVVQGSGEIDLCLGGRSPVENQSARASLERASHTHQGGSTC